LDRGDKGTYSHAEVRVLVYESIKENGWMVKETGPLDMALPKV